MRAEPPRSMPSRGQPLYLRLRSKLWRQSRRDGARSASARGFRWRPHPWRDQHRRWSKPVALGGGGCSAPRAGSCWSTTRAMTKTPRRGLLRVGLDTIVGFLKGGMASWINAGLAFERTIQVSAEDVRDRSRTSWYSMCGVRRSGSQAILRARCTSCSAICLRRSKVFPRTARSLPSAAAAIAQASQQVGWQRTAFRT